MGIYDYNSRYFDPALGRFLQADTIVPSPSAPQSHNRYTYTLNNPLKYMDPSGHIANTPQELKDADDILRKLLNDYDVSIDKDWSWLGMGSIWNPGSWELSELKTVLQGVSDLAKVMGGAQQFKNNLGGVRIMRQAMQNPGKACAHKVWLRSIGNGGFMGQWQGTWTVVHELAHAWDAANGWQFSKDLERYTGGRTKLKLFGGYNYGGTPPKGADTNFTRKEDFAESVATFVYPNEAKSFIQTQYANSPNLSTFQYSNYYNLSRAAFIAQKVNMDPIQLRHLQGNRW